MVVVSLPGLGCQSRIPPAARARYQHLAECVLRNDDPATRLLHTPSSKNRYGELRGAHVISHLE